MKKKYRKSKRYYYFRKQKLIGLGFIILGLLTILIEWDITVALFMVPIGLAVMLTKDMVITDDYFYEMEAKKFDKWKEP